MSKAEKLFDAEANLRYRATQLDKDHRPVNVTQDQARRNLRAAALHYAALAAEIDR